MATFRPNERYAMIAKTRAGKTSLAMVIAGTFAMALSNTNWQIWLLDTKGDPDDLVGWREWGFRNIASPQDQQTSLLKNAVYFRIDTKDPQGNDISVVDQAQAIINAAYERGEVIIIVDEYVSIVPSSRTAGKALLDVFQRGGGRKVGLIGLTQEPVYVPRQLLSQATHLFIFSLTHQYDVDWAKKMCPGYVSPGTRGDPHGFYYKWVDGPVNTWQYYPHQKAWYEDLHIAMPKIPPVAYDPTALKEKVW